MSQPFAGLISVVKATSSIARHHARRGIKGGEGVWMNKRSAVSIPVRSQEKHRFPEPTVDTRRCSRTEHHTHPAPGTAGLQAQPAARDALGSPWHTGSPQRVPRGERPPPNPTARRGARPDRRVPVARGRHRPALRPHPRAERPAGARQRDGIPAPTSFLTVRSNRCRVSASVGRRGEPR